MKATVSQLFLYPIKGLTPHPCQRVILTAGHGIEGDRAFALMFDEASMKTPDLTQVGWMKKQNFAVQNDWPQLAALDCCYHAETQEITVKNQGVKLITADLNIPEEREQISHFFTGYLAALSPTTTARHPQKAPLKLVGSCERKTRYPDREGVHISLLSQATLDDLSHYVKQPVDVRRFRPNIVLKGISPWQEFDLVGQTVTLGKAKLEITARIGRCNNIEVNPETGIQDLPLLSVLKQHQGHLQTGILAKVLQTGVVNVGSEIDSVQG